MLRKEDLSYLNNSFEYQMQFTCLIKCLRSNTWALTAYSLHVDCIFPIMGFNCICKSADVTRETGVRLALLALEKSEPEGTVEASITKLSQHPSACPAHLSVETENHLLDHIG